MLRLLYFILGMRRSRGTDADEIPASKNHADNCILMHWGRTQSLPKIPNLPEQLQPPNGGYLSVVHICGFLVARAEVQPATFALRERFCPCRTTLRYEARRCKCPYKHWWFIDLTALTVERVNVKRLSSDWRTNLALQSGQATTGLVR